MDIGFAMAQRDAMVTPENIAMVTQQDRAVDLGILAVTDHGIFPNPRKRENHVW